MANEDLDFTDGVVVLNDVNYDDEIKKYPQILIDFYNPKCPHCQKLQPAYSASADELKENDPPIPLGVINVAENPILKERFDVRFVPTLYWITADEEPLYYTRGRAKEEIV